MVLKKKTKKCLKFEKTSFLQRILNLDICQEESLEKQDL